jgi:hypothetical protein
MNNDTVTDTVNGTVNGTVNDSININYTKYCGENSEKYFKLLLKELTTDNSN